MDQSEEVGGKSKLLDEEMNSEGEENGDVEDQEEGELNNDNNNNKSNALSISKDYAMKHPLAHRWTLWYDNPGKRLNVSQWADHLQKVTTFDTVEDFWRIFNNIKPASALPSGSNYHLFKDNIEPKWEDLQNTKGGKWTVPVPQKSKKDLDQFWLYSILACIGETLEFTEDITGAVVSIRKSADRICFWTRDAKNEANNLSIGRQLKVSLELGNAIIGYQSHEESYKSRMAKNRYEV